MATIFTRIVRGEIPSYKVAEDERFFAFLADMIVFAKRIARKLKEKIECKKVAVVVLGLEVPHAHIHLIPIQDEKDVDFHKEKLKLSPEEFRAIADTISL